MAICFLYECFEWLRCKKLCQLRWINEPADMKSEHHIGKQWWFMQNCAYAQSCMNHHCFAHVIRILRKLQMNNQWPGWTHFWTGNPEKGHWQTLHAQIRHRIRLIRSFTVWKKLSHFLSKFQQRTLSNALPNYLISKIEHGFFSVNKRVAALPVNQFSILWQSFSFRSAISKCAYICSLKFWVIECQYFLSLALFFCIL